MNDRNASAYPDNKFPGVTEVVKKKKYPPPTQRAIELVRSSFTALDVESLASELYEDSGLLMRGNVIHELYDSTPADPNQGLLFENPSTDNIDEFDYKSLSLEEKKILLQRLVEVEERGFSPPKKEEETSSREPSVIESPSPEFKKKKRARRSLAIRKNKSVSPAPTRYRAGGHRRSPRRSRSRSRSLGKRYKSPRKTSPVRTHRERHYSRHEDRNREYSRSRNDRR